MKRYVFLILGLLAIPVAAGDTAPESPSGTAPPAVIRPAPPPAAIQPAPPPAQSGTIQPAPPPATMEPAPPAASEPAVTHPAPIAPIPAPAAIKPPPTAAEPANPMTKLDKPIFTMVVLRTIKAPSVRGDVVAYNDTSVSIKTAIGVVTHKWIELTTPSACTLRARLIDKTKAEDWLTMATFAWGMNALDQARSAAMQALALDKTLKPRTDALLKSEPGLLLKPPPIPAESLPIADRTANATPLPPDAKPGELFPEVKSGKPRK